MLIRHKTKITILFLLAFLLTSFSHSNASVSQDADYYQKYLLFQKYEKKQKYDEYKKLQRVKKEIGFDKSKTKANARKDYVKYKLCKRKKSSKSCKQWSSGYKKYSKYQKYSEASEYEKYANYDIDQYDNYGGYGTQEYIDGYNRYIAFMNDLDNVTTDLGPEIRAGLWSYTKDDLLGTPFKITSDKQFRVTDCGSTTYGEVPAGANAQVAYIENTIIPGTHLGVYDSTGIIPNTGVGMKDAFCFDSPDGINTNMIFNVNKPGSTYDHYRGKIKIEHSVVDGVRSIWVVNMLPVEQYMWGFGEIGGGVDEHSKAMLVTARTYARWHMQPGYSDWTSRGFDVLSDSGSQIYSGYDYEKDHPTIPDLARKTNGIIMKDQNGDIVMAAFCSWSDGNTRKFGDGNWGRVFHEITPGDFTAGYPELRSVADPYGKHPTLDGNALATAGNHMVGLIANGSLVLARDHDWKYPSILSYYYYGINIIKEY